MRSALGVRDTSLADADVTETRLRSAALLDCELSGIDLTGARIQGLSLHGSTLDSIRGASALLDDAAALLDAGLRIGADQVIPLAAALIEALGVTVAARPEQPESASIRALWISPVAAHERFFGHRVETACLRSTSE